jgi:hypothetical protein
MPSSVLLLAGAAAVAAAAVLILLTARLRREVDAARRLVGRVRVACDEVTRVDQARRQLGDGRYLAREGATGAGRMVRRSGVAIAGIPYAILVGIGRRRRTQAPEPPLQ